MMPAPRKVALIGFDCAQPHLIERHIAEGYLPAFQRVIDDGAIAEHCLVPFPTVTPPNWATIATGACAGAHQVTDYHVHVPGTTPTNQNIVEAFSSNRCQAEFIWDAAEKAGKKCIVLNYPGSWPSKMKNGIMVGGAGLTVGEFKDGLPNMETRHQLCWDQLITTGAYPLAIRGTFEPAVDWIGTEDVGAEPLQMPATLNFLRALEQPAETTWYVLARRSQGDGYDRVTLSPSKDLTQAFCTLAPGEWSPRIVTTIIMRDGAAREVFFRCKLLELSPDASDFRLFLTAMGQAAGWSSPPGIAPTLLSKEGTFAPGGSLRPFTYGWFDLDTFVEISEQHATWLGDAATTLLTSHNWDLFFMHSHPPDWTYHALMSDMDPHTCPDEGKLQRAWDAHRRIYQAQDRMLARILEVLEPDTLVVLVSDHGATPDGPMFDPYKALVPAGLTVMQGKRDLGVFGRDAKVLQVVGNVPDPQTSKAFPQREVYVYVNLKGRDPEGIVEPVDYERVQQQIIDALYTYVDPETGKRPVSLALTKQDARLLGLYGDGVGDVIYALYPWFGSQHGQILPTGEYGVGSLRGLLVLQGPGIKQGVRLARTVHLTDVVPTLCYLLDLPVPEHVEGGVIYQAFEDPNFKTKEIGRLRDDLARLEAAMVGG